MIDRARENMQIMPKTGTTPFLARVHAWQPNSTHAHQSRQTPSWQPDVHQIMTEALPSQQNTLTRTPCSYLSCLAEHTWRCPRQASNPYQTKPFRSWPRLQDSSRLQDRSGWVRSIYRMYVCTTVTVINNSCIWLYVKNVSFKKTSHTTAIKIQ